MNKLILVGRIVRDPEVKAIGDNNMVAKFTVAVNRNYKDKDGERPTDFIPCEAFGKTAEFVSNYLTKGRLVSVEGEMRIDQYETAEGEKRSFAKCHVNTINALDSANKTEEGSAPSGINKPATKPATKPTATKPAAKKPTAKKPVVAK